MKRGIDAKIEVLIGLSDVECAGFATWTYSGETRSLLTQVEFGTEYVQQESGLWEGGEITLTGFYKLDSDAGQQQLRTWFQAATHITSAQIKLYVDGTYFLTPDDSISPASYIIITKFNETGQDVNGLATFNATMKVSGRLKEDS